MTSEDILWNIASVLPVSTVNGPGRRVVIWVQGCTLKCPGCFSPELQPHEPRWLVEPVTFAQDVTDMCKKHCCEGITITGGEPLQQSRALELFTQKIKEMGYSTVVFTGYTWEKVVQTDNKSIQNILKNIDIVIAGPYDPENNDDPRTWNNNKDKDIMFLTDRYSSESMDYSNLEVVIDFDIAIVTGFPNGSDITEVTNLLSTSDCIIASREE